MSSIYEEILYQLQRKLNFHDIHNNYSIGVTFHCLFPYFPPHQSTHIKHTRVLAMFPCNEELFYDVISM